jgi:hypothetical protein
MAGLLSGTLPFTDLPSQWSVLTYMVFFLTLPTYLAIYLSAKTRKEHLAMSKEIDPATIEFFPFIQIIDGEDRISYTIFARVKNEDGTLDSRRTKIGEVAPDTDGTVTWINDRSVRIYDEFYIVGGESIQEYVERLVDRLRFEGRFVEPLNVSAG